MITFEEWLVEEYSRQYNATDNPDIFDNWICHLEPDEWIKYGNEFAAHHAVAMLEKYGKRLGEK